MEREAKALQVQLQATQRLQENKINKAHGSSKHFEHVHANMKELQHK
jgi:hypothetical protein